MKSVLKRALTSPVLITIVAFAFRIAMLMRAGASGLNPVRENLPFGYELGAVAASIASGHGFSSPLRWFASGPTAWFAPIYPYLAAGVFKLFGIYSYKSYLVLECLGVGDTSHRGSASAAMDLGHGLLRPLHGGDFVCDASAARLADSA
jgi:hypothetical protein